MIIKLLDGTILHDGKSRILIDPVLKRGLNKAGELSFTIRPEDIGYKKIYPKITMINVFEDDNVIWSGRVDTCPVSDLFKTKKVTASGILSLMYDMYTILQKPSGNADYWLTLMQAVNASNAVSVGSTPITIYAESDEALSGNLWIYWQESGAWKRSAIITHQTGSEDLWTYFCTILRSDFYLRYDGTDTPSIRIRASVHGTQEKTFSSEDPEYQMWRQSVGSSATSPGTASEVHQWYFQEYCFLTLRGGNVYNLKPINNLMLFDVDNSVIASSKAVRYPYQKSFGRTLDFFRHGINQISGRVEIVRNPDNKKLVLKYAGYVLHSNQEIRLKRNLIDYNEKHNFEDLFTSLILYEGGDGEQITLYNVQDSLYTSDLLSRAFGSIVKAQKIEDDFDLDNPAESINEIFAAAEKDFLSISIKMFDEAIITGFAPMTIGEIVTIRTKDTRIEEVTTEIVQHLNEPEKNEYSFGVSPLMLSRFIVESTSILEIGG